MRATEQLTCFTSTKERPARRSLFSQACAHTGLLTFGNILTKTSHFDFMTHTQGDSRVWLKLSVFCPTWWFLRPNRKKRIILITCQVLKALCPEQKPIPFSVRINHTMLWLLTLDQSIMAYDIWITIHLQRYWSTTDSLPLQRVGRQTAVLYLGACLVADTLPQHNGPGIHLLYACDETEQICFDWTKKWTNLIVWITDLNGVFNEISNGTPVSLLLQQLRFTRCHMVTYSGKSFCKVIRCQRVNQLQGNIFYVPYSSWLMTRIQKY